MSPDEVVGSGNGCHHSIAESTVDVPIRLFRQIFGARTACCSRALLHSLQLTSDCCFIFASHLATRMIPAIAIISRLLCLQETRGSFKYFPKKALLSLCHNMKSAVHVLYAGWLMPCSALARTHDFKNFLSPIQVFSAAARPSPCFGTMPHIVACVCSPQECTQVVCSNREAWKRPARRHSRNGPWT